MGCAELTSIDAPESATSPACPRGSPSSRCQRTFRSRSWGPLLADRTVVVHVGDWRPADWSQFFVGCRDVAHIDNGLGIQNGEQGVAVTVCTGLRAPWTTL